MTFPLSREKLKYLPFACVSNILSLPPVSLFLLFLFFLFPSFFFFFRLLHSAEEERTNDDKCHVDNCSTVDYKVTRKAINTSSSSFGQVKSGAKFRSSNSNQVEVERIINAYGGSEISENRKCKMWQLVTPFSCEKFQIWDSIRAFWMNDSILPINT